jgi:hypothetical protein
MKTEFHNGGTGTDRNLGVGDVLFYLVLPSMCVSGCRGARVRIRILWCFSRRIGGEGLSIKWGGKRGCPGLTTGIVVLHRGNRMMIVGRPFFPDSRLREYRHTREGPTIIVKHGPFYSNDGRRRRRRNRRTSGSELWRAVGPQRNTCRMGMFAIQTCTMMLLFDA